MNRAVDPRPIRALHYKCGTNVCGTDFPIGRRVAWKTRPTFALLGFAAWLATTGCQLIQNPFADEFAHRPPVTTASVNAARAAEVRHVDQRRPYAETQVRAKDEAVTHGALYYEDPLEETLDRDGRFAWAPVDYLYWLYGPAYYFVDSVMFPVSVLTTPPWRAMESDGHAAPRRPTPGRHDAKTSPTDSTRPSAPPQTGSTSG